MPTQSNTWLARYPQPVETETITDQRKINDLVDRMIQASTPQERNHLAVQLRTAVDNSPDIRLSHMNPATETNSVSDQGPVVVELARRLQDMLISVIQSERLAAIAAHSNLVRTQSETISTRAQRASNAIRLLYQTPVTDIPTARAAADFVGKVSQLNSKLLARQVNHCLKNSLNLLCDPKNDNKNNQLSMDRARAAMILSELAGPDKIPKFVLTNQKKLRKTLWHLIWDSPKAVRREGVRSLCAILETTTYRAEPPIAQEALDDVMTIGICSLTLTPECYQGQMDQQLEELLKVYHPDDVTHGSLLLMRSVLSSKSKAIREELLSYKTDLYKLALKHQKSSSQQVREAVAELLPLIVILDRAYFANNFLDRVQHSTMFLIKDQHYPPEERGYLLISLSAIAEEVHKDGPIRKLLRDTLQVCSATLYAQITERKKYEIPRGMVITAITHLAKASKGYESFEKAMRDGLLSLMFSADFTRNLVDAVTEVGHALPHFKTFIRERMINLIAATLKKRMHSTRVGLPSTKHIRRASEDLSVMLRNKDRPNQELAIQSSSHYLASHLTDGNNIHLPIDAQNTSHPMLEMNTPQTISPDFFRQFPFSAELHRIDSSLSLADLINCSKMEGLVLSTAELFSPSHGYLVSGLVQTQTSDTSFDEKNYPCIALKAILSYDFSGMKARDISSFANEFVLGYVESKDVKVRALAVAASAKLLKSAATIWAEARSSQSSTKKLRREIQAILIQLLSLAVADPSVDVRFISIRSLDEKVFRPYLLQPEMLKLIFLCFHDTSLAMRGCALALAGKLSSENPAAILPALRRQMKNFFSTIWLDGDALAEERRAATELLFVVVKTAKDFVQLFASQLMEALYLRMQDARHESSRYSSLSALLTIAELGGPISHVDLKPYKDAFMPLVVDAVLEAQSADGEIKKAAVRALTALVQNTGSVIEPYSAHPNLLNGLMAFLGTEDDPSVRLEVEVLMGSLGAANPGEHASFTYPSLAGFGRRGSPGVKWIPGGSNTRSSLTYSSTAVGSRFGQMMTFRGGNQRMSNATTRPGQRNVTSQNDTRPSAEENARDGDTAAAQSLDTYRSLPAVIQRAQRKNDGEGPPLTIFGLGGKRLAKELEDYYPVWEQDRLEEVSLVAQLQHPYTSSPKFYASVALDVLHDIITKPRLHLQHQEACVAIFKILQSAGPKCNLYLPAVVPRLLWLIAHSPGTESFDPTVFTQLQQQVMEVLNEIILTAGHHYLPFAFDTVLLAWNFLKSSQRSLACVTSACGTLTRLMEAIDDDIKPVLTTIIPLLLSAIHVDHSRARAISTVVLDTLQKFGPLLEDHSEIVLKEIVGIVTTKKPMHIRTKALESLKQILRTLPRVEVLSNIIHPLIQTMVLADENVAKRRSINGGIDDDNTRRKIQAAECELQVLSASALIEISKRTGKAFDVFVPVIAKALIVSDLESSKEEAYHALEEVLLRRNPAIVNDLLGRPSSEIISSHSSIRDSNLNSIDFSSGIFNGYSSRFSSNGSRNMTNVRPQESCVSSINEPILMKAWHVDYRCAAEDWQKWIDTLGSQMFEQSGSPAFRACVRVSESYPPFNKRLFHSAFLSCWNFLSDDSKSRICETLERALVSPTIPLTVLQILLQLFEFMDHDEQPLPAGADRMARTAAKCGAYAKAIRYLENDYTLQLGKPENLVNIMNGDDGLIATYEKLDHTDSAFGTILHYEEVNQQQNAHEEWYEKLRKWDNALEVYSRTNMEIAPDGTLLVEGEQRFDIFEDKPIWDNILGRLRCLDQIGEWRKANKLLHAARKSCNGSREAMQQLALEGKGMSISFDLRLWDEFEEWVEYANEETFLGWYYNTIKYVRQGTNDSSTLECAAKCLDKARKYLDVELSASILEGYQRAYDNVLRSQLLVELEEMIDYLNLPTSEAKISGYHRLQAIWDDRLEGCRKDRPTWYHLLTVRSLVQDAVENKHQWLEFARMCRKDNKRLPMESEVLRMLLLSKANAAGMNLEADGRFEAWNNQSILAIDDPDIRFACIKHIWATGSKKRALKILDDCKNDYLEDIQKAKVLQEEYPNYGDTVVFNASKLAGEVFSKLSKWGTRVIESSEGFDSTIGDPLEYAEKSTLLRPDWHKAWHYWGLDNLNRFDDLIKRSGKLSVFTEDPMHWPNDEGFPGGKLLGKAEKHHLVEAVRGYFNAIHFQTKCVLEDSLKVLSLWFMYGRYSELYKVFDEGFKGTDVATWLEVLPQIIARLHITFPGVQAGVKALLTRIGKAHPHITVYPLTVAKTNTGLGQELKCRIATEILEDLKTYHKEIVEEAELVSSELVRVAILWAESWLEKLEEASKAFFTNDNAPKMLEILMPEHQKMEAGASSACEQEFINEFGESLQKAGALLKAYEESQHRGAPVNEYIAQAWQIYQEVFRGLQRYQQLMHTLELSSVSHRLSEAKNLRLAVPGQYDTQAGKPVVAIQSFNQQLEVMQSKQRPRKLSILGSDGNKYDFLLKGHEDLRQDERVMQVFSLINKLFAKHEFKTILNAGYMRKYDVIALSRNAGLIEWVPNCDTMHTLVKEHREARSIIPNLEHRFMLKMAPEHDRLSLLHKVDLFEFMLLNTKGSDIAKVLWLKSNTSELWLERRTVYARSLATTSMAGYLMGLGDRHPSNLMIERESGKILHIDFGDCFEIAMKREKYPEKIPFRLTRMLVEALEPCGVAGIFRHTAEAALGALRERAAKESLKSVIEAFVYDPLIRWKLMNVGEIAETERPEQDMHPDRNSEIANGQTQNQGSTRTMNANGNATQAGASVSDLVRDIVRSVDRASVNQVVRSLQEAGSLSASLRLQSQAQRCAAEAEQVMDVGAIPTPSGNRQNYDDTDLSNLETPNQQARREQERLMSTRDPNQRGMANVSNVKAKEALLRFEQKLEGRDYDPNEVLNVPQQVDRLIWEARNVENLCSLFLGWCAFW